MGAHKAALMGFVAPCFGTKHHHKSVLVAYVQNGLKSLSLTAKPPIKPHEPSLHMGTPKSCLAPHPGQPHDGSVPIHTLGRWISPEITWFSRISYTQNCTPRSEHLPSLHLQMNPCNLWKTQPSSSSHIPVTTSSETGTVLLSSYLFLKVN